MQTPPIATADAPPLSNGLRILLVDDSETSQILTVAFLRETGCTIDIAANGQLGLDAFRHRPYDLVLMDVEMPVMDGWDAVREIRRIEKENDAAPTPVLALTAHRPAEVAAKAAEAGFTSLLSKPIRRETLLAAVATHGIRAVSAESPDYVKDLVPAYLEKRRRDVVTCRRALETGDFDVIRRLGHNMKGTGSGYGLPRLTELGAALETAALASDVAAIRVSLDHFADYLMSCDAVGS